MIVRLLLAEPGMFFPTVGFILLLAVQKYIPAFFVCILLIISLLSLLFDSPVHEYDGDGLLDELHTTITSSALITFNTPPVNCEVEYIIAGAFGGSER